MSRARIQETGSEEKSRRVTAQAVSSVGRALALEKLGVTGSIPVQPQREKNEQHGQMLLVRFLRVLPLYDHFLLFGTSCNTAQTRGYFFFK